MVGAEELSAIPLFSTLTDSELQQLAPWFEVRSASSGVQLTGEGAHGYSFFILLQGTAVVTSEGAELATYGPGDFFGEIAILGDGQRTATVTTTSPAKLLFMFGTEFRRLQAAHPDIAGHLEAAMRQRLGTLTERPSTASS
jgi:CRP-like cAMP-binding protein